MCYPDRLEGPRLVPGSPHVREGHETHQRPVGVRDNPRHGGGGRRGADWIDRLIGVGDGGGGGGIGGTGSGGGSRGGGSGGGGGTGSGGGSRGRGSGGGGGGRGNSGRSRGGGGRDGGALLPSSSRWGRLRPAARRSTVTRAGCGDTKELGARTLVSASLPNTVSHPRQE